MLDAGLLLGFARKSLLAQLLVSSLQLLEPFDLHVLGMPPAFVLSQDQTLQKKLLVTSY